MEIMENTEGAWSLPGRCHCWPDSAQPPGCLTGDKLSLPEFDLQEIHKTVTDWLD